MQKGNIYICRIAVKAVESTKLLLKLSTDLDIIARRAT